VIEASHRNLRIDSRSRVTVSRSTPGRTAPSPCWETARDVAFAATGLGPSSPVSYVFASSLVPVLSPVTAYAAASFPAGIGVHREDALRILRSLPDGAGPAAFLSRVRLEQHSSARNGGGDAYSATGT